MTVPAQITSTTPTIDQARAIAAAGLRVLPIKPGEKFPPMKSWQHAASVEDRTIDSWWNGLYRNHGIGIAMGPQPDGRNVFALDIDDHDPARNGHDALDDLEAVHGALPDTVTSLTGAGGQHLLFTAPADVSIRNQQNTGNRVAPGIDVRGAGGQIVAAPTVHPDTERRYEWDDGRAPWEIDIAPAPAWLLELVVDRPAEPITLGDPAPPSTTDTGDSIAATVRDWWDWNHQLSRRGWQIVRTDGADTYWCRPGKDPRRGHSAVLHGDGPLVVFTSEIPPTWLKAGNATTDGSGWAFSAFGFYAAAEHDGDRSGAAKALRLEANALDANTPPELAAEVDEALSGIEDDWGRRDVVEIARQMEAGEWEPEVPTIGVIEHADDALVYAGRLHSIFGQPGGSKTWIALALVAEVLKAGGHVLMIDWEDAEGGTVRRLLRLGCSVDDLARFDYRNPATSLAYGWAELTTDPAPWTFVVIDSTGEALAAQGINPNDDGEVAAWMSLVKRLTRLDGDPAVLMLDHVPKAGGDTAPVYAIGSQRKLAAVTGASYRCDTVVEPAKGKAGKVKLVVAKDRLGTRAKGSTACEAHIADTADGGIEIELRLSDAQAAAERGETFRPTVLMERVSRYLEDNPDASGKDVEDNIDGKAAGIRLALRVLVDEGWVRLERGRHNRSSYASARIYRDGFTPAEAVIHTPERVSEARDDLGRSSLDRPAVFEVDRPSSSLDRPCKTPGQSRSSQIVPDRPDERDPSSSRSSPPYKGDDLRDELSAEVEDPFAGDEFF